MGMIQDFKDFAFKGNLLDMAVGIVMGTAVAAIVKSFLANIITPLIAMLLQVPDLSGMKYIIGEKTPRLDAVTGDAIKNAAGDPVFDQAAINYGTFIQNTMDFAILAFVIFIGLRIASKWMKAAEEDAEPSDEVKLLTEIRDSMVKK